MLNTLVFNGKWLLLWQEATQQGSRDYISYLRNCKQNNKSWHKCSGAHMTVRRSGKWRVLRFWPL